MESEKNEPIFEIKKWNAVALWAWDIYIDTCTENEYMGYWRFRTL